MTSQREIAEQLGLPIHPPKVEVFDLPSRTNTDPKSRVREVDEYRIEPFGLFMARSMAGHPRLRYLRSWLLPALGLRISRWDFLDEADRDSDFYLDIVDIESGPRRWRSLDLYLDILLDIGQRAELVDIDEFVVALRADLLDEQTAQRALETAHRTVDGLARHGYQLDDWLAERGVRLSWQHGRDR